MYVYVCVTTHYCATTYLCVGNFMYFAATSEWMVVGSRFTVGR